MQKLLSLADLRSLKGIHYSRSQIHRKTKEGTFPQPVKLGPGASINSWLEAEIDEWVASRVSLRDATTNPVVGDRQSI